MIAIRNRIHPCERLVRYNVITFLNMMLYRILQFFDNVAHDILHLLSAYTFTLYVVYILFTVSTCSMQYKISKNPTKLYILKDVEKVGCLCHPK